MPDIIKERRWAIYAGIVIMLVTSIPYIVAYSSNEAIFTGFLIGVEDGNSYIAKMLSGAGGEWFFKSPYTAFPQSDFLAFFPYLLLGKLTNGPGQHDQLIFLFHLFRIIAGVTLTVILYHFSGIFLKNVHLRRITVIVSMLGGGLGCFSLFWNGGFFSQPLEFYSPETFGLLSALGLPHLLAARSFLLLGFIFFLKEDQNWRNRIAGGACWFLVGFFQPLTIATGWIYVAFYLLLVFLHNLLHAKNICASLDQLKPRIISAVFMGFISSPWVLYNFFSFNFDPYLKGWASQNLILSPAIQDYLLSFSVVLPFVIVTIWHTYKNADITVHLFPAAFVFAFPLLAYAPFNMQRRLPDGIWIALVILALSCFDTNSPKKRSFIIPQAILIISLVTPAIILIGFMKTALNPAAPAFRQISEIEAFDYLNDISQKDDVILAAYDTSNALPAWASVKVLAGLGPESIHLPQVSAHVNKFYSGVLSREEQIDLIKTYSVDFVFYGPNEKHVGDSEFFAAEYLTKVYDQNGYSIYRIQLDNIAGK